LPVEDPPDDEELNSPDPFSLFPEIETEPLIVRIY